MPCNCCSDTNEEGYGVGLNAPSNTTTVGLVLLDSSTVTSSTAFSLNTYTNNGSAQIILQGDKKWYLFVNDPTYGLDFVQVPGVTWTSGHCYFMELKIISGTPKKMRARVRDGTTGTFYSAQLNTTASTISRAHAKTEDSSGTYIFWIPNWTWSQLTQCGISANFWADGFVYQALNTGESRKINMQGAGSQVRLGKNATGYIACGTQLW